MIRHCVMFRFEDSVTEAEIGELSAALDALPAAIPEIVTYRHGRDLGLAPTNFDYSITADFATGSRSWIDVVLPPTTVSWRLRPSPSR